MGFQTPQTPLRELLPKIRQGEIQLPDFQRGYVWEGGHPLGVVMTLQTGNDQVRFKPTPVQGAEEVAKKTEPKLLLLDGQQRLTSLTQAMSGSGVVTCHDRGKIVTRRFFIDINKTGSGESDMDDAVLALPADGVLRENFDRDIKLDVSTREKQVAEGYFPFSLAYSDEGTMWLWDYPDKDVAREFLDHTLATIKAYGIPSIELDRQTSKEAVSTVFGKVNQGGTRLTVFELLTAKFAGDGDYFAETGNDFRLKEQWNDTKDRLHAYGALQSVQETEFLQAVMLLTSLHKPTATTARKDNILKLDLADYLQWADKAADGFIWVAGFLDEQHIHVKDDVPYPSQLVPLAVLHAVLGKDIDVHGVNRRIQDWYWCGVLGELYSSATESRMARDVEQVPDWARGVEGAVVPRTVAEASFVESRLHRLKTRRAAAYKGIYALLMRGDARDWLHNQPFDKTHFLNLAVDIHHIFPKAWCIKNEIDPVLRESIVNKTPLAAKTNRMLSGHSPAVYMPRLDTKVQLPRDEVDRLLEAHLIDSEALRAADFSSFFRHRREALLQLVEEAMNKPAVRDIEEEEPLEAVDAGSEFIPEEDEVPMDDVTDEDGQDMEVST
ncbi:GmrSD restriction endonuclease domain-containing protein [Ornithinimicrobium sp. W1679]|uniref:GmrSD restriction endonuclease domain-containing protein n=1 Tax=Ornithinimicrobium sp. W1679 TaxID=3418770 RepID=UPI003CEDAC8E